jgi:outer membrane protein assembly factor BamB
METRVRWRFSTGTALTQGPVSAGDLVLVADVEGCLYALDAVSGRERWRHRHDRASSGIVATEQWVLAESGGDLWPHDRLTGKIALDAFPEMCGRPVQATGNVLLLQDGSGLGAVDLHAETKLFTTGTHVLKAPVAVGDGGMVAAGTWEGNASAGGLHAFDLSTGRLMWSQDGYGDDPVSIPPFHPVIAGGRAWTAVCGMNSDDDPSRRRCDLAGFDLKTGGSTFSKEVGFPLAAVPCCAVATGGDLVFVVTAETDRAESFITAFTAVPPKPVAVGQVELTAVDVVRSTVAWSRPLTDLPVGAPVLADGLLCTLARDGVLLACDAATGTTRWTFITDERPGESIEREWGEGVTEEPPRVLPDEDVLFVQTATTLLALERP